MGTVPCLAFARLNDADIVTACEGDVLSAASMLALKYIADDIPTLMDLSEIDASDDSVLFWHCGVGSRFYAKGGKISVEQHFNPGPYSPEKGWAIQAPVAAMEFAAGQASIMRFTNDCGAAFVMEGGFFEGKPSHDGSRGWMKDLSFNGETITMPDLVNTILTNGFHHHYPMVRGSYSAEIMEFCYWLGLKLLRRRPYTHHNMPGVEV
jgi:L-fucose isomerase-like protein